MTTTSLAQPWAEAFFRILQTHDVAVSLKEAALTAALGVWTEGLTSVVAATCQELGWGPAAKGHLGGVLPLARHEYLALDVMAFRSRDTSRWPFPIAVFELENSREEDRIAYSLRNSTRSVVVAGTTGHRCAKRRGERSRFSWVAKRRLRCWSSMKNS